jgi:hypothetical protein
MGTRGRTVRISIVLALALVLPVLSTTPASAMTVKHLVNVERFDTHWGCPGPDPVEHATTTVRITEFWVGGVRVRSIEHWSWKGRVENRDTGELLRDDGAWTTVYAYSPNGHRVIRGATSGSVWRFTVPGVGIVVHETGRQVFGEGEDFTSTFGGFPDTSALCKYV